MLKRLSLIRIPTPPDPLTALLEIFSLLFSNHLYPGIFISLLPLKKVSHTHSRSKSDAIITFSLSLQWSFLTNPLMFHTPHLTLPSVGEYGLAGLRAVASGLRSAVPGLRSPAIAVARGPIGISGVVMLGEVEDFAQSVGGEIVCVDDEKVGIPLRRWLVVALE